jgi:hypothetical protein
MEGILVDAREAKSGRMPKKWARGILIRLTIKSNTGIAARSLRDDAGVCIYRNAET